MWVSQLFDLVRFISPTQPTFMTPLVSVGNFSTDLRYRDELIHGRPLLCSYWSAPDADEAIATLDLFSRSRMFWYSGKSLSAEAVGRFKFRHINTARDSADLVP